jgi:hypothetical protein
MNFETLLAKPVACDTTTRLSNLEPIHFVRDYLARHRVDCSVVPDRSGSKSHCSPTSDLPLVRNFWRPATTTSSPRTGRKSTTHPSNGTRAMAACIAGAVRI